MADFVQLGRLNLLTPTRVKAAAAEIKLGEMVSIKSAVTAFGLSLC